MNAVSKVLDSGVLGVDGVLDLCLDLLDQFWLQG